MAGPSLRPEDVGAIMAELGELKALAERLDVVERDERFAERWRETVDKRLERVTDTLEKLRDRLDDEAGRRSEVDIHTLALLNQQARASRPPKASKTSWGKVVIAVAGAIAAVATVGAKIADWIMSHAPK